MMTLTEYLTAEKISQAQFAQLAQVTQGTVSKLCKGRRPGWDLAGRISEITGGKVPVEVWLRASSEAAE